MATRILRSRYQRTKGLQGDYEIHLRKPNALVLQAFEDRRIRGMGIALCLCNTKAKPATKRNEEIMKIKGYSFKCENPFFVYLKKHYCPYCGEKLIRKKVSQIIHSDSEEAKNYDFEVADITVKGNMKFTHIEFYCSVCQKQYTVKETKENDFLIDRWK